MTGGPYGPGVSPLIVAIASPGYPWVTGAVSLDLLIDGEEVRATNIAGAGPQTFTVTRGMNGVNKTLVAGKQVRLARPVHVGLAS